MPFVWALLAGVLAVLLEWQFRRGIDWLHNLWWIAPASLAVNYFIARLLFTDFGWLPSIVLFGATTAVMRIALAFVVMHEPPTPANLIASGLLVGGVFIRLFWR
jgi:drug/metabolite transporter (DMT)-like permease